MHYIIKRTGFTRLFVRPFLLFEPGSVNMRVGTWKWDESETEVVRKSRCGETEEKCGDDSYMKRCDRLVKALFSYAPQRN